VTRTETLGTIATTLASATGWAFLITGRLSEALVVLTIGATIFILTNTTPPAEDVRRPQAPEPPGPARALGCFTILAFTTATAIAIDQPDAVALLSIGTLAAGAAFYQIAQGR
jgi:hypothetical protein